MRSLRFSPRVLLVAALALLGACGSDGSTPPPAPLAVDVSGTPQRGATVDVRVTRDGAAVDAASVQWSFSPAGAAEVAGPGRIRLLQVGEVTLTARVGSSLGSTTVSVAEPPPPPLAVEVQGTPQRGATLAVAVTREGVAVDPAQVQWTFAPAGAAEVAGPGQIRLLQSGSVTLSARVGASTGQLVLAVSEPPPSLLVVTLTGTLERGSVVAARVTRDGTVVDPATVSWQVSPAGAATLVSPGQIRLVQSGVVTLTATAGGSTGQVVVTVAEPPALVVTVSGVLQRGAVVTASVTRNGVAVDPAQVSWQVSPSGAVTQDSPGQFRLVQAGIVTLIATLGESTGSAVFTVAEPPPPSSLVITLTGALERGAVVGARVTRDGAEVDAASVTWTSDPAGAIVVASPGQLRLAQAGTVTLTATAGTSSGQVVVTVAEPPALVVTVSGTLQRGSLVTASVTRNGVAVDAAQVSWQVSPSGAVTQESPGQFRLVQSGNVTLIATAGESTGSATISVAEPPPSPLVLAVTGTSERGATVAVRVTRDGAEVDPATVTWTSTPAGAVENLGGGRFRLLQAGSVTLSATAGGSTGQATLQVAEPAALVVEATGRRERGLRLTLRVLRDGAVVAPGDVTWTVSPAGAVEFAADGTARLLAAGAATLTARVEHRTGQTSITVATPPTVVFERVAGTNRDIWRVALDGAELGQVTTHPGEDQDPTVSATGTVVFTSFRNGNADLFAVPLAGGTERLVAGGAGSQSAPSIQRGGGRVAYVNDAVTVGKIWTVNTDGTGAARATPTSFGFSGSPEAGPAWNPAGTRIAFVSGITGGSDIYSMVPGQQPTPLVSGPAGEVEPAYSPDGTRVAFVSNRDGDTELYVMDLSSGAVTRLTTRAGADAQPSWTTDGRIVFVATVDGVARLRWLDPESPAQVFEIPTGAGPARNPAVVP